MSFFSWFVGVPALVTSAVVGLYSSVQSLFNSLFVGNTVASSWVGSLTQSTSDYLQYTNDFPTVMALGAYALSLDIILTYVVSVFSLFLTLTISLLTFFCVTVPVFLVNLYAVKFTAWFLSAMFPKGALIQGLADLASLDISTPVRNALKDGKYNPWLSS